VTTVEDWSEIRMLHQVERKAIASRLGVSRNAVASAAA